VHKVDSLHRANERGKNKKVVPKFGGNKIITYLCSRNAMND
jgi:hypothetical protein